MQTENRKSRRLMIALVAALTAVLVAPTAVWAVDQFTDVPDANVFHDDIAWLKDAAVTLGCNPPDNTQFCPSDTVTREQMAAFIRRLAENQVVDAGAVGGVPAADLIDWAFYSVPSAQGKSGYVWACEEAMASYDPVAVCDSPSYSYNASGDAISITRSGAGTYNVTFVGLGDPDPLSGGGNVQVTAYGGTAANCQVVNWNSVDDVSITVRCWDLAAPTAADSQFTLAFTW